MTAPAQHLVVPGQPVLVPVTSHGPLVDIGMPRLLTVVRDEDVTGISGVGRIMYGCAWDDGVVVTRWNGVISQVTVWPGPHGIKDLEEIHGHGGKSRVHVRPPQSAWG